MRFGRIIASFLLASFIFLSMGFTTAGVAAAQDRTGGILPGTGLSTDQCRVLMDFVSGNAAITKALLDTRGAWGVVPDEEVEEVVEPVAEARLLADQVQDKINRAQERIQEIEGLIKGLKRERDDAIEVYADIVVETGEEFQRAYEEGDEDLMEILTSRQEEAGDSIRFIQKTYEDSIGDYRDLQNEYIKEIEKDTATRDELLEEAERVEEMYAELRREDPEVDALAPPSPVLPSAIADETITHNTILACGIRTGAMKLWMIPYYIRSMLEFVVGLAGLIAVAGTVYGGYLYLFAGLSADDKEKGKKAMMYGIAGMVLTLVAWAIVNIFITLLTRL